MNKIKEKLKMLPGSPGVYLMKDKNDVVIYVGKAKVLKNRVSSYFQSSKSHNEKTLRLVERIEDFDYFVTGTEFEALVLECNLIKNYSPKYNILLKDDKNFPFIKINLKDQYPSIAIARKRKDDGASYFGPYSSAKAIRQVMSRLQKIFGIASCKKTFPRDIGKERPCLNYQMKRCIAPCSGNISPEEYHEVLRSVVQFLEGDHEELKSRMQAEMETAAENLNFERAARIRDQIQGIKGIEKKQKAYLSKGEDIDIIALSQDGFKICIALLSVRDGKLLSKDCRLFPDTFLGESEDALTQFILQYYLPMAEGIPPIILIPKEVQNSDALSDALYKLKGRRVEVRFPQRGSYVKLLELAEQNAAETLRLEVSREEKQERILESFRELLGLPKMPRRIESYDISHTGGANQVGAMVVFTNGVPDRNNYRNFKIRNDETVDDYRATKEVIYRRLEEGMAGNEKFLPMPDLILLDGGAGHVNSVKAMMSGLELNIPLFGMVKDNRHRCRGLIGESGEVSFGATSALFPFVSSISEEVHRVAISFHKKQRKKTIGSELSAVSGIGEARRKALLRHFGSMKAIKEADIEELKSAPSINGKAAEAVYEYFRREDGK